MGQCIKTDNSIISVIWDNMFKLETYYKNGEFTTGFGNISIIDNSSLYKHGILFIIITITVRKVYTRNRSKDTGDQYFVVDTDNKVYQVDNLWFKLDFNRADDWASLVEGHT